VVLLREGFAINVMIPLKAVPEVCTVFCPTERESDVADRRSLLRAFGYKLLHHLRSPQAADGGIRALSPGLMPQMPPRPRVPTSTCSSASTVSSATQAADEQSADADRHPNGRDRRWLCRARRAPGSRGATQTWYLAAAARRRVPPPVTVRPGQT
jgi:hypothetical protein